MNGTANGPGTPRTLWRRLGKLVARKLENVQGLVTGREHSDRPSLAGDHDAEVFPWTEHAIVAGAILGAVAALRLGRTYHFGLSGLAFGGLLGAAAGALCGVCVALSWAIEVPAHRAAPQDLWDPWLDSQNPARDDEPEPTGASEDAVAETGDVLSHWRARVRPRVISSVTGESLPLDDTVGPILESRDFRAICLLGPSGSGKTTALNHLAGLVPPHLGVAFLDQPLPSAIVDASSRGRLVFTAHSAPFSIARTTNLQLAPWGEDERIEYLLASDRQMCASVMARLASAKSEAARLDGIPELWRLVLDRMMADKSVPGPRTALRTELAALLHDADVRQFVETNCFYAVGVKDADPLRRLESVRRYGLDEGLFRLIRHRPVQLLLAADWIERDIKQGAENESLALTLCRDVVLEVAARIADDSTAVERLRSFFTYGDRCIHPMVASLLHALRIGWKPSLQSPHLARAYLNDASWANIDLTGADLRGADLAAANLSGSRLERANFAGAEIVGATLCDANMADAILDKADLSRASLLRARAERTRFESAQLVGRQPGRCEVCASDLLGREPDQRPVRSC